MMAAEPLNQFRKPDNQHNVDTLSLYIYKVIHSLQFYIIFSNFQSRFLKFSLKQCLVTATYFRTNTISHEEKVKRSLGSLGAPDAVPWIRKSPIPAVCCSQLTGIFPYYSVHAMCQWTDGSKVQNT